MKSRWIARLKSVARALWTDYREWIATLSLGFAALALGYIGFAKYFDATGETRSHLDIMYLAWQLFTLESGGVSGTVPTELEIARVLAPLATASAALSVLLLFLREQARKLKLVFVHNHVIVCGLGRTGVQIVEECLCEGLRVVAVEEDGECGTLDYCRELGAIVVVGDATKGTVLLAARADCARALVAICGNDGANIQIAMTANDIVRERARSASKGELLYYVQVMNYSMATLFKEHPLLTDSSDYHSVHFFNAYENAVRQLFHSRPIDREPIVPEDGRQAHLIVLGIGQMGESVIVQALKLAHFANGIPLKITALDRIATRREKSLAVRHANLEKVCDIAFEDVEFDNSETLDRIKALASGDSTLTSIVICSDDDARNVEYALSIRQRLGETAVPIYVRLGQETGFTKLIQQEGKERNFYAFGSLRLASSWRMLLREEMDCLARTIHEDYVVQRLRGIDEADLTAVEKEERRKDPALKPWPDLAPTLRDSNRQQADHIPVKLRAVGMDPEELLRRDTDGCVFTEEQVETLARMEHARWNAERLLAGWKLGESDKPNKITPYLVPYEDLPENIKEYDREAVRNIPRLLRAFGQKKTC